MTSIYEHYIDQDGPIVHPDHIPLREVKPRRHSSGIHHLPQVSAHRRSPSRDPGLDVLGLGPGPSRAGSLSSSHGFPDIGPEAMTQPGAQGPPDDQLIHDGEQVQDSTIASLSGVSTSGSRDQLQNTAALAIQQSETKPHSPEDTIELASRPAHRVDSAQESVESIPKLPEQDAGRGKEDTSPLTLQTTMPPPAPSDAQDSIAQSPTLRKHVIQVGESSTHTLPGVHATSPTTETVVNRRRKESLPSFKQLADLADIASQQSTTSEARPPMPARQHSHSIR